jgi:phosphonate transport system permease protein
MNKTNLTKNINVAIAPASNHASGLELDGLLNYLTDQTAWTFTPLRCKSYEEALNKLDSGEAEMGWLGPFASSEGARTGKFEAFAVGLPKGQLTPNYHSVFITRPDAAIKNLAEVKNKKIIIGDIHSTSGYIVPKRELNDIGINLDNSPEFSEIIITQNHDEAIKILLEGRGDVAAVSSVNLNGNINKKTIQSKDFRIIHTSKPIPGAPLVFSSTLPEQTKETIKSLVFSAHKIVQVGGYGGEMERYIDIKEGKKLLLESYLQPQWKWPTFLVISIFLLFTVLSIIHLEIDPLQLFQNMFSYLFDVINRMMPPDFSNFDKLLLSMLETVEMAFLGTLLAITLSIPFGFLSASNVSPNYPIYIVCRIITIFSRAVPEFIMAMILVIAVGFGAVPGVLALGLHTMGFLAKFYAEAIEHVDPGPGKALSSMGASQMQVLAFAIVPQVLPSFIGNNLYILDRNVRMATMLGIVGAGGIGYELQSSFRMFNYPRVSAIIILIFLTIYAIDMASSYIRKRVL